MPACNVIHTRYHTQIVLYSFLYPFWLYLDKISLTLPD